MICADELGPVIPRSFPPAPGWTLDGHRVKAPLEYSRGPEKTWVYGALRVGDGHEVTMTAPSRNSAGYQRFLGLVEQANPTGTIVVITDNLSSHTSASTRTWLLDHPRIQHAFIPKRACWLNLPGGLVATVPPPGAGRGDLRRPGRDRPGDQGGDLPAQRPRPPMGVGPPTTVTAPTTPRLHLPDLANAALAGQQTASLRH